MAAIGARQAVQPINFQPRPRFPNAEEIPFAYFNGRYVDCRCHVIGRGPTTFDYRLLSKIDEPIFFINDAVCLEKYARSETYFFAHDAELLPWLDGRMRSTAVLPVGGKMFGEFPGTTLNHAGRVVFYRWPDANAHELLRMGRDQIAEIQQLYTHTGTIHSLIHFLWFCGFAHVTFVGCDCINDSRPLPEKLQSADGYDPRLQNLSRSVSSHDYTAIGKAQRLLTTILGLEVTYVGMP